MWIYYPSNSIYPTAIIQAISIENALELLKKEFGTRTTSLLVINNGYKLSDGSRLLKLTLQSQRVLRL